MFVFRPTCTCKPFVIRFSTIRLMWNNKIEFLSMQIGVNHGVRDPHILSKGVVAVVWGGGGGGGWEGGGGGGGGGVGGGVVGNRGLVVKKLLYLIMYRK